MESGAGSLECIHEVVEGSKDIENDFSSNGSPNNDLGSEFKKNS